MADDRADPVGADHELGFDLGAIGERESDAVAALLDSNEAMVEVDQAGIQSARQSIQQVGAVKRIVRRAETSGVFPPVIELDKFAGLHVPRIDARGRSAYGGDLVAEPDGDQRPCCVRGHVDGCTDFAQGGRRFKDFGRNPEAGQRIRCGQSREPTPDDHHACHRLHHSIKRRAKGCWTELMRQTATVSRS